MAFEVVVRGECEAASKGVEATPQMKRGVHGV